MALDQDSLEVLARALKQLDAGFSALPEFSPEVAGARRMEEVLLALAEKLAVASGHLTLVAERAVGK